MEVKEALASGQDVTIKPDGSAEMAGVSLPGLPEGLLVVGYREAENGDLVLYGGVVKTAVSKTFGPQFIVKLAPGYGRVYDILRDEHHIVKAYDKPKEIVVRFCVRNTAEEVAIRQASRDPLFVRFEE